MKDRFCLNLPIMLLRSWLIQVQSTVGEHNLEAPNISLACGLFWSENKQGPKDSGRMFDLLHKYLKIIDRGPLSRRELSLQITTGVVRCVNREELSKVCLLKFISVSHCLHRAQQTFVYQTLAFFISINVCCLPLFWNHKPLPLISSFVFHWK